LPRRLALAVALTVLTLSSQAGAQGGLARTPPLGWDSWYAFHCRVTEQEVLANAQALVTSGMASAGYRYVVIDGCWEAAARDPSGALAPDSSTFPDGIAYVASRVHALGLKLGIYTSAGRWICNHRRPGSYGHFAQDMRTFAAWGADYVKVDWCSAAPGEKLEPAYAAATRAVRGSGRRMLMTVSTPGSGRPWTWAHRYGSTWRIAPDLTGSWRSLLSVADVDAPLYPYAGPGRWNDADILQVGNRKLSLTEQRSHISLWAMLASPLLAGNDLSSMPDSVRAILTNPDALAIDQDRLGHQGRRVSTAGGHDIWVRRLAGGAYAVLVLNRGPTATVSLQLNGLSGLPRARKYALRDLWTGRLSTTRGPLRLRVARHGAALLRVRRTS